jgi:hypothetical protein
MPDYTRKTLVLVATTEDLLNKLRDALSDTNVALLHVQNETEAINLLERLRSEITLAIIQLELPGTWDLVGQLTRPPRKPLKVIATTSQYPAKVLAKVSEIVDVAVPAAIPPEEWRKTVETVLVSIDV